MEAKLIVTKEGLNPHLENLKVSQEWLAYADVVIKAMELKLIATKEELIPHLENFRVLQRWVTYVDIIIKAKEIEIGRASCRERV